MISTLKRGRERGTFLCDGAVLKGIIFNKLYTKRYIYSHIKA
jgi:hypothetical protein